MGLIDYIYCATHTVAPVGSLSAQIRAHTPQNPGCLGRPEHTMTPASIFSALQEYLAHKKQRPPLGSP